MNVAIKPQRIYGTAADAAAAAVTVIHSERAWEWWRDERFSCGPYTGVACALVDKINSYIVTSYIDLGSIHVRVCVCIPVHIIPILKDLSQMQHLNVIASLFLNFFLASRFCFSFSGEKYAKKMHNSSNHREKHPEQTRKRMNDKKNGQKVRLLKNWRTNKQAKKKKQDYETSEITQ